MNKVNINLTLFVVEKMTLCSRSHIYLDYEMSMSLKRRMIILPQIKFTQNLNISSGRKQKVQCVINLRDTERFTYVLNFKRLIQNRNIEK